MIKFSKRKIDMESEKKILMYLITNVKYINQVLPIIKPDYFQIPYSKRIIRWISDYYQKYKEAPSKYIQDIFNIEKNKIPEEEADLISTFLEDISLEYSKSEKVNTQYQIDSTVPYIKARYFELLGEEIISNAKLGNISDCEKLLTDTKTKSINPLLTQYINFHDIKVMETILENQEINKLFSLPGDLGKLMGPFKRSCMYGIMGRSGIGKSFMLREIAVSAATERLKVAEFNLEMSKEQIGMRHYKRITGFGDSKEAYLYPIADCMNNQMGICQKKERINKTVLFNSNGEKPSFGYHDPKYKPCSICRGSKDFDPATWVESIYRKILDPVSLKSAIEGFNFTFGDNIRTRVFPKFTATIGDIEHELDMMEYNEGFIPDIVIIDYDDLISPERVYGETRNNSDEIYKRFGGLVQRRNICGVLGIQTNREGAKRKKSKTTDVGEDWRKIQHLDGLIILNQTDIEKKVGVLRAGVGKMRDDGFCMSDEVQILQNLELGQSNLDSFFIKDFKNND